MSATLLSEAIDAGLDLWLVDGEKLKAAGPEDVVQAWAPRLRENKADLIRRLQESSRLTVQLIAAAMRACDHHGDGPEAREQMRHDCEATPPHLQADLTKHFETTYPKEKP